MRIVTRNERGSIPITVSVMFVVSALVIATLTVIDQGLRVARRSGDSANAVQVADAGVNDAIQTIPTVASSTFTRTGTLSNGGSYTYTATRDPGPRKVWHIDSTSTDPTGVKRRVRASAVAAPLFNSPIFVNSSMNIQSGMSLDSFKDGTSHTNMCTKKGVIGTNSPSSMNFTTKGQGGGVTNCQNRLLANGWAYSMDGCVSYGDGSQGLPPAGTGQCPPSNTWAESYKFDTEPVNAPEQCGTANAIPGKCYDLPYNGSTLVCDPAAATETTTGDAHTVKSLRAGKGYFYSTSVTLLDGCSIDPASLWTTQADIMQKPVVLTSAQVVVGNPTGNGGIVNAPPSSNATLCGASATSTVVDGSSPANSGHYYCPTWSSGLRVRVLNAAGSAGWTRIRGQQTKFWAGIEAPAGAFYLDGSGIEVWGAVVSNTAQSNAQFTWHFDDSLTAISTSRYWLENWREEPVT